ncbi:MAG: hypothetical protein WKF58_07795 [Ilumatobacteraceae bacterium]
MATACCSGHVCRERGGNGLHGRHLASLRRLPLRAPPPQLALDVPLAAGQIAETTLVDVNGVKVDEHVDEVLGAPPALLVRHRRHLVGTVEHRSLDVGHDVERRARHGLVAGKGRAARARARLSGARPR